MEVTAADAWTTSFNVCLNYDAKILMICIYFHVDVPSLKIIRHIIQTGLRVGSTYWEPVAERTGLSNEAWAGGRGAFALKFMDFGSEKECRVSKVLADAYPQHLLPQGNIIVEGVSQCDIQE